MDLEVYTKTYLHLLGSSCPNPCPGCDQRRLARRHGMMGNDGSRPNETRFWDAFSQAMGQDMRATAGDFDTFYRTTFHEVRAVAGENPAARELVTLAKQRAERVILATNPLYPLSAVESRLSWIGLTPQDFDYVTTYAECTFCKPNPRYFTEVLQRFGLKGEECLVVGNDLQEDGAAARGAGIPVHIVTDCLIPHTRSRVQHPCRTAECAFDAVPAGIDPNSKEPPSAIAWGFFQRVEKSIFATLCGF